MRKIGYCETGCASCFFQRLARVHPVLMFFPLLHVSIACSGARCFGYDNKRAAFGAQHESERGSATFYDVHDRSAACHRSRACRLLHNEVDCVLLLAAVELECWAVSC